MQNDLPLARRDVIAGRLAAGQPVVAAELAAEFTVSEDAIRRDLRALAAEGRCRRVYGGALPLSPAAMPMSARMHSDMARKAALAEHAAQGIQPGELLFLDNGSTNLALVDALPEDQGLTIATNSVDIAAALLRRPELPLILLGGAVDPLVGGCVDASAVQAVSRMRIDRCFIGACAIEATSGVWASTLADATFKRALLAASRQRIVLAIQAKLAARAAHHVADWAGISQLILEHDTSPEQLTALAHAGAQTRLAS
ncbi:transcriptional regulator, DeoR family [Andreprevotia lacus DSM 23236]|jgi:DeoR/GlpR family transcriptional regulator of sugar metabolism|uniref:Transcriptional regulator, DeoR family n=1 Tax=Andreprevotia lacus DSM 23236 TaxID=1121001 RepID=A0A1W1XN90_9NEIS|nr:DeoR/GlpR family DNA-binding transcription regulator [Andreprevotia lacus]SMC25386.1 transcriptional regulator, DeoR family [Andreprevotia lacus DSM 23236]